MRTRSVLVIASLVAVTTVGCTVVASGRARGSAQGGPPPPGSPPTVVVPPPLVIQTPSGPLEIAGTPVVRVGINFEDLGAQGDRDYNDAVLCFEGAFRVDGTKVVSTEAQRVIATTSSHSDCRHEVRVEIHHADGTVAAPLTFDSRSGQQVPLELGAGSRLEVTMHTTQGGCPTEERSMHAANDCEVQLDRCNTTGQ